MGTNELSDVLNQRARATRAGTPSSDPRSRPGAPAEAPRQVVAERLLTGIQAAQSDTLTIPTTDWL